MNFASKKDTWFFLIIWGSTFFIMLASITELVSQEIQFSWGEAIGFFSIIITVILLLWIWFGTYYRICDGVIKIRCGPFRSKIKIREIKKIKKVKNPLASPALSFDKLEILYGKYDVVCISPKKEEQFINVLLKDNPQIELDEVLIKCNNKL